MLLRVLLSHVVLSRVFMVVMALCSSTAAVAESGIQVDGAYVREPIPGRYMSAAFMTLNNTSGEDKVLVRAEAEWTGLIEIHTHLHDNGVMRMRQVMELPLPAGEQVSLQPGGLHLMLFKLSLPLADQLPLTLCFSDGSCETITAELRSLR